MKRFSLKVILISLVIMSCQIKKNRNIDSSLREQSNPSVAQTDTDSFLELADFFDRKNCSMDGRFCGFFSPIDMPLFQVGKVLHSAKRKIRIATYNMDVKEYIAILKEKLSEGVEVEFSVDYKLSFGTNLVWNSLGDNPNLKKYRLPVFRGGNPQMHNKVIIVDDEVLLLGSANWTYSGLLANYENVLMVRDEGVIKKYNDELDELTDIARASCQIFADVPEKCGTGEEKWPEEIKNFLSTGEMLSQMVRQDADPKWKCDQYVKGYGLFDTGNQPVFHKEGGLERIKQCLVDPRFITLAEQVSKRERFVDGAAVSETKKYWEYKPDQKGEVKVYFSPEDNVEDRIIEELRKTLATPSESFAYVSTNFITNRDLAATLKELFKAGVRLKMFFDRGRLDDPNFQQVTQELSELGFTESGEKEPDKLITIFNNTLTGPYGCNHNKLAVIGTAQGLTLLNGSANWSKGAMNKNDENLIIIEDDEIATVYLNEIMSQLFVYRYEQNIESKGFKDDLEFLSRRVPCLDALLGLKDSCQTKTGQVWNPITYSHLLVSVNQIPIDQGKENLWLWSPQANNNKGKAIRLFTHEVFDGRWLASIPVPPNWEVGFKVFIAPNDHNPNENGGLDNSLRWEYQGSGNDRREKVAPFGVHAIRNNLYVWGRP